MGHNSGRPVKSTCFEDALSSAIDFVEGLSGEPFTAISSGPSKWGGGTKILGPGGTELRIEIDDKHGPHINARCKKQKATFEFPGDTIPGWAR